MSLLLVMLHTGTMFSVIVYFWKRWKQTYFRSSEEFGQIFLRVFIATLLTGAVGYPLKHYIETEFVFGRGKQTVEQLFGRLDLIAPALFCGGLLSCIAGLFEPIYRRQQKTFEYVQVSKELSAWQAAVIGAVQGLSLPFRGFSRSGSTISTGMLIGVKRKQAESFSFALAVVLTPPVVVYEILRLVKTTQKAALSGTPVSLSGPLVLGVLGMSLSFLSGLGALRWLEKWLEGGMWLLFGTYCLFMSGAIYFIKTNYLY
ncbi:Undecaprenyl-diphosphatase [Granulicella sibirica]|uniref:Undecaprenyl-diphosphatase n=2 Tax=Granulicella sibirica TaxID=2479048 RepID=A0A4Q0T3V0_9BACT|nr:Undecaprenyl-diphosphatase [Granulicella sibirica]